MLYKKIPARYISFEMAQPVDGFVLSRWKLDLLSHYPPSCRPPLNRDWSEYDIPPPIPSLLAVPSVYKWNRLVSAVKPKSCVRKSLCSPQTARCRSKSWFFPGARIFLDKANLATLCVTWARNVDDKESIISLSECKKRQISRLRDTSSPKHSYDPMLAW